MGKEADPVNLEICAGWEIAEYRESEDEEHYPCDDTYIEHWPNNPLEKMNVKSHPSGFVLLSVGYSNELRESSNRKGKA